MKKTSELSGFYKLNPSERLRLVKDFSGISDEDAKLLSETKGITIEQADKMIENVIGIFPIPIGVAVNFVINEKNYLIPMAIEEPSVVAAASNSAKMARSGGGFHTSNTGPIMIGQIQTMNVVDPHNARLKILESRNEILSKANEQDPILVKVGGGCLDLHVKVLDSSEGYMIVTELEVDCRDAMGANAVNTMTEAVAPIIDRITGGRTYLRIISNLASKRLVRSRSIYPKESLGGPDFVDGILNAHAFAVADEYRCSTHNKGIMNGVTAVAIATGQDTRAIEAGAHTFSVRQGRIRPLTRWEKNEEGDLVGSIEIPMAVGLIGGATAVHPIAKICVKIIDVESATELGEVMASVGLAQNLAALRALSSEGIQKGHMRLHARNIAISAGASGEMIDKIATKMTKEKRVRFDRAKELLEEFSKT
jgi:hydroxymethylglutaryl-CoA reductase